MMLEPDAQLDVFPTKLRLLRVDESRNMRRFCSMTVQRDLFGKAILLREWGRIGCRGTVRLDPHEDEGLAISALLELAAAKRRRGYSLI